MVQQKDRDPRNRFAACDVAVAYRPQKYAFKLLPDANAVGWCELANFRLQEDMHDLAAEAGARVGYVVARSDDDFREAVVHKAKEYGIELKPNQVVVQRTGSGTNSTTYLAADYWAPVKLAWFSFTLHFTPSSTKKTL